MLRTVRSASELVTLITRLTDRFPPEERYVMVQDLRQSSLTVLENTAIGYARIDQTYKYKALTNAVYALTELSNKFTLCKRIAVLTDVEIEDLNLKCDVLKHQINVAIKNAEFIPVEPTHRFE